MKTKIYTTLIAIACICTVNAQNTLSDPSLNTEGEEGARFFFGGEVSYWNDIKDKVLALNIAPEFGYLFNDDWGLGLLLGYKYKSKTALTDPTSMKFSISPFVRYYYFHNGPFNLYFDAGFGFNTGKIKINNVSETTNGFEVGVRPGACVDLTEGLCLCMRMGFFGYRKDYFSGEEEGLSDNGFGIRFAPEELMIGLEFEF